METKQRCYVIYSPNGGHWADGSTDTRPSPTENGMLCDLDRFVFPEGTNDLRRDGYRLHTSINYFNVPRYYTANGKGEGINTAPDYNNGYGYDCWPWNAMELTRGGHDENYIDINGLGLSDGDTMTLYACWDPIVTYHLDEGDFYDFVYLTSGSEYTVLALGEETRYALNRSDSKIDGIPDTKALPSCEKTLRHWIDKDGGIYAPHDVHSVTEPLDLYPVWE